jgi:hypothetical protein
MSNKNINLKSIFGFIILLFAFFINYYSGTRGVFPLDSFSFFDTGYNVLNGKHPVKDYWVFSGIILDYIQAFFFYLFGVTWNSYLFHSSFFNSFISIIFFYFLIQNNLNIYFSFLYSLAFSILCYPVSGTPFSYQHSLVFSLGSIFIFLLAHKSKKKIYWFFLPLFFTFGFFSNQTPSAYITLILIIFLFYIFFFRKEFYFFLSFLAGCLFCFFLFLTFLYLIDFKFNDFYYQYILFPLTLGQERVFGADSAFVKLTDKITFKGLFLDFKFIHIFIFLNIYMLILSHKKKLKIPLSLNQTLGALILIISSIVYIFHQLITANQIFIFSLIVIIGSYFHLLVQNNYSKNKLLIYFSFILIIILTIKYFKRYTLERYFMDLASTDISLSLSARNLDSKLNHLRWISPGQFSKSPNIEIYLLKEAIDFIKNEKNNVMIITHYSFFSSIIQKNLNMPNRWYVGNNTHPNKNHKYFNFYKNFFLENFINNNIKIIYIIDSTGYDLFNFKDYLNGICFKKTQINTLAFKFEVVDCS